MGLIREPIEIDFTLLSRDWTVDDEKEFSELIKREKLKYNSKRSDYVNFERNNKSLAPIYL